MKYTDENEIAYDPDTTIQIQLHTSQGVAFQSSRNPALVFQFNFPVTRPTARLMGRWIIEFREHNVYMRENKSGLGDDRIMLSFEEQAVGADITYTCGQQNYSKQWENVRQIDVYPREASKVKVTSGIQLGDTGRVNHPDDPGCTGPDGQPQQVRRLQQLLDSRVEELILTAQEHGQSLDTLTLQKIEELHQMHEKQARKEKELETVKEELDAAGKGLRRLQEELDEKQIEKEQLDKQLEQLSAQKEFLELDCSKAGGQLAEMRIQASLDKDVLTLLEDSHALKHGTVLKTMEEIGKEIEKVEERIAGILKYRMKFNDAVEEAIFSGDGTIHSQDETGGTGNGDRGAAS